MSFLRILLAGLLVVIGSGDLWAHGATPAVLGVVDVDDAGPSVVKLSRGFAAKDGNGNWRYVCPSSVGGFQTPLFARTQGHTWIFGPTFARLLKAGPEIVAREDVAIDGGTVYAAISGDTAWVLGFRAMGGRSLWRLEGPDLVESFILEENWVGLIPASDNSDLLLARSTGTAIELGRFDGREATPIGVLEIGEAVLTARLRRAGGASYLWVWTQAGFQLFRVAITEGQAEFTAIEGLFDEFNGPTGAETAIATGDSALFRIENDRFEKLFDDDRYTCVTSVESWSGVCAQEWLYAFEAGSVERVFQLADIYRPPADLAKDDALSCEAEWADFGGDSGFSAERLIMEPPSASGEDLDAMGANDAATGEDFGSTPPDADPAQSTTQSTDCACSAIHREAPMPFWAWLVLGWFGWSTRRCERGLV